MPASPEKYLFSVIRAVWLLKGLVLVTRVMFDEQSRVDPELDGEGLMTGETLGYLGKTLRSDCRRINVRLMA